MRTQNTCKNKPFDHMIMSKLHSDIRNHRLFRFDHTAILKALFHATFQIQYIRVILFTNFSNCGASNMTMQSKYTMEYIHKTVT